jgi:anti-sigma factor RsiW
MTQTPQSNQAAEHLDLDTLNAFIDGELPPHEQQTVEQHLKGCHACTLRVLSGTQLKAATARAGNRFAPPPEALARITVQLQSRLQPVAKPKKAANIYAMPPFRIMAWSALAAAIILCVSLLGWHQLRQTNTLAAELLDQHLATLSTAATPQVISTDRHTVKPWFQGRLPFSFNLPDAAALPPDITLKGADLTYLNNQPAALLLFTIHKHDVSVFITQRATSPNLAILPSTRAGFTLRVATTPDLRIIAVSDVNAADLELLVATLIRAQISL